MTIEQVGVFAFRWRHATTGQVGRIVRTHAEAVIDWTQRCIYRMMND